MSRSPIDTSDMLSRDALSDRLKALRLSAGLTQQALADALGLRKSAVCNWEAGRSRPDIALIPRLCRALGITTAVFFCEGDVLSEAEQSLMTDYRTLSQAHRTFVGRMVRELRQTELSRPAASVPVVPLRRLRLAEDSAEAGTGDPMAFEGHSSGIYVRETPLTLRADWVFAVNGESMSPDYPDGCRVLVRSETVLRPGEIGVFRYDGALYLKEYRPDGLHSLNPDYAVLPFVENTDCRAIGRVLGKLDDGLLPDRETLNAFREANA